MLRLDGELLFYMDYLPVVHPSGQAAPVQICSCKFSQQQKKSNQKNAATADCARAPIKAMGARVPLCVFCKGAQPAVAASFGSFSSLLKKRDSPSGRNANYQRQKDQKKNYPTADCFPVS